jgi:hypothetical protein
VVLEQWWLALVSVTPLVRRAGLPFERRRLWAAECYTTTSLYKQTRAREGEYALPSRFRLLRRHSRMTTVKRELM